MKVSRNATIFLRRAAILALIFFVFTKVYGDDSNIGISFMFTLGAIVVGALIVSAPLLLGSNRPKEHDPSAPKQQHREQAHIRYLSRVWLIGGIFVLCIFVLTFIAFSLSK